MMQTRLRRWLPLGAIVLATALAQPITNAVAGSEPADPNAAVATVKAGTATATPNGLTNADAHATNPTAAQIRAAEAAAAKRPFAGPRRAEVAASALAQGPSSAGPVDPRQQAEPVGLSIFRNTQIPSSGLSGGYANVSPTTGEPSTDINGKNIFQTGNWYATYSKNGGTTWTALNPFTIFGSGFCCDQITIYDSARDRWFWVLQYGNHLTVANSAGGSLTSWCSYNFTPQNIGAAAGAVFDYNDLALGTRFLYLTSNVFPTSGSAQSAVLRLPLSEMITCSSISYNFIRRSTEFTYKAATGSGDTALIASNNLDTGTGTTLRIFSWPENSTSFSIFNRAIPAFTYMGRNSGQNCASADAVVNNWCNFGDSRVLGGAKGGNLVAWSWNAKQSGSARPKPYTRLTVVDARTATVLSNEDVFGAANAIQYMSLGTDDRGHIGMVATEGGGVGTTHKYPSPVVFIRDDVDPSPGFAGVTVATGLGGGCASTGGVIRWGDYQTSRAVETADGLFIGAGIRKIGTACTGANNPPRNFVYGRARSLPGYNRWRLL